MARLTDPGLREHRRPLIKHFAEQCAELFNGLSAAGAAPDQAAALIGEVLLGAAMAMERTVQISSGQQPDVADLRDAFDAIAAAPFGPVDLRTGEPVAFN